MGNTTKHTLFFLILFVAASASAQPDEATPATTQSISLELLGPNIIGLSFDSRIRGKSGLGYRVGIGYNVCRDQGDIHLYGDHQIFSSSYETNCNGFGIPLEVNYLLGRRKHKFEAALGASLGYHRGHHSESESVATYEEVEDEGWSHWVEKSFEGSSTHSVHHHFGYLLFARVGYRLQPLRGVEFRLGVLVGRQMREHMPYNGGGFILSPYLSLGYSFPRKSAPRGRQK